MTLAFVRQLVLVCASLSVGCAAGKMAVPDEVARSTDLFPIQNRSVMTGSAADESFNFGPYRASNVDRKFNRSIGLSLKQGFEGFAAGEGFGGHSFDFVGPGGPLRGECNTQRSKTTGIYSDNKRAGRVACTCGGAGVYGEIDVAGPAGTWNGQAALHGYPATVVSIDKYEGGLHSTDPIGFEVRGPQSPLGAVEIHRPGRVWLSRTLDPATHAELACLFTGLLLYIPPDPGN